MADFDLETGKLYKLKTGYLPGPVTIWQNPPSTTPAGSRCGSIIGSVDYGAIVLLLGTKYSPNEMRMFYRILYLDIMGWITVPLVRCTDA